MTSLSALHRPEVLQRLQSTHFDLLVIGGGITGVGIALDAASRGLKTALIEKEDFSSGTSSRSTKLIHGGLRYLKQFEIALVREVGRERAIVHRLAPHLVTSEKMLLPLIKGGTFGKLLTSFGLMVYDILAGVETIDQRRMLTREETLKREPLLDADNLEGGGLYAEYRTDDARLTIEVMKTAVRYGATCVNYTVAEDFIYKNEKVSGAKVKDILTGKTFSITASLIVSAAGPWVDELRDKDHSLQGKRLHLTKGVHIVIPHERFPVGQAIYFDVRDGRMVFAIPRGKVTYIGTTDTDFTGDKDHVVTDQQDVNYLLDAANNAFPSLKLATDDVVSSWAGLRPLIHEEGKSASELSRKDEIFISKSGLISIAGGKLTGYRKMAERVVDRVVKQYVKENPHKTLKDCFTDKIVLEGGDFADARDVRSYCHSIAKEHELEEIDAAYLVGNYGKQSGKILDQWQNGHLIDAEADFCINQEMATTLCDFFIRRTGRLYFDIESVKEHYKRVAEHMRSAFGWDNKRYKIEVFHLEEALYDASHFKPV
ncbi:Aerobic glycerol-3-phosphate dehydrogenase [Fulvivirga imtechensis AK7]|uniref:Glycerol-3-phosphate dehydrogenase n=1 Tax=Fulvivirga imtechensis AK7 TaxID=1237149 RepID=L8JW85_9BACT|nr:glycerol-3-phosphate dehydrogenase/oxidase [Fulvivirga imtechensis]ELR71492.1 Aerobic glycerol-3-phosphate dehydrogenase [Fulvivirga imtechensis AK7]